MTLHWKQSSHMSRFALTEGVLLCLGSDGATWWWSARHVVSTARPLNGWCATELEARAACEAAAKLMALKVARLRRDDAPRGHMGKLANGDDAFCDSGFCWCSQ